MRQAQSPVASTLKQSAQPRLSTVIKQKYPGEYDDYDDDELEKMIVAKFPGEYDDWIQPKTVETKVEKPKIEEPTFLSRAEEATPAEKKGIYPQLPIGGEITTDPTESLLTSIPKRLFRELDAYTGGFGEHTIKTGIQGVKDLLAAAKEPTLEKQLYGAKRAVAKGMYSEVGVPFETLESDILGGHYGAAAGDVAVPAAMMAGMHQMGKLGGVKTRGINPADMPFDTVVKTVPDVEPPQLTGRPPSVPPPPKQLPGPGGSTATRLPGTPPTSFTRQPEVPPATPATFVSHPSGAVGDVSNWNTPETLSALNVIRPAEGTTPPIVGNPFKKNALPPIEQLPTVDTSIIEQRRPPIQPQPDIIPQPPPVVRPPQMGMVPTQPIVEPPLQQSPIVSKFKPDIGPVAEGEPRPVGSGSTIPRKQGLFNRLFGDATGTFDPEAMGKEIERLKQQFLEKQASKRKPEREPIFHDVPGINESRGVAKFEPPKKQAYEITDEYRRLLRDKTVEDHPRLEQLHNELERTITEETDPAIIKDNYDNLNQELDWGKLHEPDNHDALEFTQFARDLALDKYRSLGKKDLPEVDTSVAPEVKEISGVRPADYEPQEMRRKPNQAERVGLRNIRVDALKRDIDAAYRANDINKVVNLSQQLEEINRPPLGEGKIEQLTHKDRSDVGYEALPEVDMPQEMKVAGVKEGKGGLENIAMGGANERTLDVLGTALYSRERPVTVIKELLQNSFDEHKEHGIVEPVRVLFNGMHEIPGTKTEARSITVRDRGKGLSPDEMYTVLTNIGETGKAGVESASGGFGFAKAAPFMGGSYVRVRSIVDTPQGKQLYTFEGSPEQLKKQTKGVALNQFKPREGTIHTEQIGNDTPAGLEVTVWYDKKTPGYYPAKEWAKNMTERSPSAKGGILYTDSAGSQADTLKQNRDWLDETKAKPLVKNAPYGAGWNYPKEAETAHVSKPMPTLQDKFEIPGAKINIHYDTVPGTEASSAELHFSNKGMYQGTTPVGYGDLTPNVPTDIVADIIATVEEGQTHYPFSANREQIQTEVTQAINKWVQDNIVSGIMKKRIAEIQKKYDGIAKFGRSGLDYLDSGNKFTPDEIKYISGHPTILRATAALGDIHRQILTVADSLGWTPENYGSTWTKPSQRLKKFGLLFQEADSSGTVLGIHIPRPDDLNNSAILINLFEHLNTASKATNQIDGLSTTLLTTLSHEYAHIPGGGHDKNFAYRDADLHSALGKANTVDLLDQLVEAFDDGTNSGRLNPEISNLLRIYNESRKRAESGDDALIQGGINIKRPPDTKGPESINTERPSQSEVKSESIEPVDWTKAGEVPVNPEDYGQVPKVIKLGKGLSKLKPEPAGKLEYEDLPTAPVKPKRESTLKPGELNTSRFGGGKEPPKEPPNKLTPEAEPEPPEKPKYIPPERIDVIGNIRNTSEKPKEGWKEEVKKKIKEGPVPPTVEKIIADKKAKTAGVDDATFTKAIKSLPKRFRNLTLYKGLYEGVGVSGLTKLKRMGEAGVKLAKMIRDERTESNRFGGELAQATREARRNLSKAEQTEVVKILDGQKPLREASSQAVRDAYKSLRATTEKLGNEAIKAGVRMRDSSGEIVPFDKLSGEYFPHRYPEELFKDPKALRDKLLKAGNSPAAVDAMMDRVTKKGERFSSAQHTRDFDLPGYHETLDALEAHQYEMARVITRAKRFGPGDVSDANSPISKLIKESSSPAKAEEVVNAYLNRKEGTPELEAQQKIANIAVQAEVWSKLSQFFITNMGDLNTSAHTLGIENTSRAFVKTLSDPHNSADIATRSGALGSIKHELANDVTAGKILGKAYGTVSSEKFVRTVEALAGRAEVGRLFELAKKDKRYHSPLSEFVDGDVKEVLKQDKLTDEQLDFASGRAAEMTSGIPDASTLSKAFMAKNPIIRTLSLFKRFSFLNMKNLSEAIKRTPTGPGKVAKIAAMIVGFQVAGEVVGDIKALIKGLASGDISGDIERRGDYIGFKNKTLDRIMANYLQSAFFGLVGDAAESIASRPLGKISGTLGGPVVSDADELAGIVGDLMTPSKPGGFGKPAGKSRFHSLGMAVAKRIPYIGAGLKERWDKEKEQGLKGLPAIK